VEDDGDAMSGDFRSPSSGVRHPFVHIVIDEDHQTILEETPRPELGYVIPRWVTIGGFSQYAYSPTAVPRMESVIRLETKVDGLTSGLQELKAMLRGREARP
jgi:hypothetical protein